MTDREERPSKVHDVKEWPKWHADLVSEKMQFETRKNDRDYRIGDVLVVREWDPDTSAYTGKLAVRVITYIMDHADLPEGKAGWVTLGWDPPEKRREQE